MKLPHYVLLGLVLGALMSWGTGLVSAEHVSLVTGSVHGPERISPASSASILFVGDVLLARYVEKFIDEEGFSYPFALSAELLSASPYVVGNFEASIPESHVPTRPMTFRFSVQESFAQLLANNHFTHLFLANNHAWDFGEEGYAHTHSALADAGLAVGGHPNRVSMDDVEIISMDGYRVAVVPIHAVFRDPAISEYRQVLGELASTTDMQVAYVHWGEEYEPVHSRDQEALAHALIDAGADAIVGHHPHVVQDIDIYKDAPIFYSLGNFIFDQYWNDAVKSELAVRLVRKDGRNHFELIPLWSERANPTPLEGAAKEQFLLALARKSEPELAEYAAMGTIPVPFASVAE